MTRLKQFGVAGLLLALALTVAACGGRNAEATSPAEDPGPAVVERAPVEAPVAAVNAAAAAPVTNVAETDEVNSTLLPREISGRLVPYTAHPGQVLD